MISRLWSVRMNCEIANSGGPRGLLILWVAERWQGALVIGRCDRTGPSLIRRSGRQFLQRHHRSIDLIMRRVRIQESHARSRVNQLPYSSNSTWIPKSILEKACGKVVTSMRGRPTADVSAGRE